MWRNFPGCTYDAQGVTPGQGTEMKLKAPLLVCFGLCLKALSFDDIHYVTLFTHAESRLEATYAVCTAQDTVFPKVTDPQTGAWKTTSESAWTSGFFAGCLWQLYQYTERATHREYAQVFTDALFNQQFRSHDHDGGFIILPSYGELLRIGKDSSAVAQLVQAAQGLSLLFDEQIGCTRSWDWGNWNFPVIIDNMMNLELLFLATELSGQTSYAQQAISHADKTLENHVRSDGSTFHVVDYNSDGSVAWQGTRQGWDDASTWSRGQAWAVYGFTLAYRYTGLQRYLLAAQKTADWFLAHLPADTIPWYDFSDPNIPEVSKDASAAAIVASALYELADFSETSRGYQAAADMLLTALVAEYLSAGTPHQSILQRASQWKDDPERGAIYGDYYVLQAAWRSQSSKATTQKYPVLHLVNPRDTKRTFSGSLEMFDAQGRRIAPLLRVPGVRITAQPQRGYVKQKNDVRKKIVY